MQHPLVSVVEGGALDEDAIVAEAYKLVAEGYRRALMVSGLPDVERECLRETLRAVCEIAHEPHLSAVGSPHANLVERSQAAG
jgi:hypothetical protein